MGKNIICHANGTMEVFDDGIEFDAQPTIQELQQKLADTDYKIIKCAEYQLTGLELPYDLAQLHAERQPLRDQINELEVEL